MAKVVKKVAVDDSKINLATILIQEEDHTLGNIIRHQLLKDKSVKFAGYKRVHPLINDVQIKVQTNGAKTPCQAVVDSCDSLTSQVDAMERSFREAFQRFKGDSNPELMQKGGSFAMQY